MSNEANITIDEARALVADAALWPRIRDFLWDFAPQVHKSWLEGLGLEAIDAGRLLVVSPFSKGVKRVSHETAEARNRWILENCDDVFWGSVDPDGTLARLAAECGK